MSKRQWPAICNLIDNFMSFFERDNGRDEEKSVHRFGNTSENAIYPLYEMYSEADPI